MKIKKLLFLMLFSVLFLWLTNWESVNLDDVAWQFGVFFCNNKEVPTKELQMTTMPWNKNEICLYFVNDSEYDLEIEAGIVDWYEDEWEGRSLNCNLLKDDSIIYNYTEKNRESPLTIPANTRISKNLYITFPVWTEWEVPTCLVYSLVWDTKSAWDMFSFKFRTAYYLDFFVAWEFTWTNKISIKKNDISLDPSWAIIIDGIIQNDSALNNVVNITWIISNIFGYHKEFVLSGIKLKASGESAFNNKDLSDKNYLPRYKWLFNIKLHISYQPYFEFDASNLKLDPDVLEEKQMIYSTNYFEMPRTIVWVWALVVLLMFFAFRKPKTKIVYVNQNDKPEQS